MCVAAGVGALGTFLPWAELGRLSVSGTAGDGWITLALFAVCLRSALVGDKEGPVGHVDRIAVIVCGLGAGAIAAHAIAGLSGSLAKPGVGLFAILGGAGTCVVVALTSKPSVAVPLASASAPPAPPPGSDGSAT